MSIRRTCLMLLTSIAAAAGAAKEKPKFAPGPASSYATRQTNEGVTIAAVPYETEAQAQAAFGKLNPYRYGILPVLVIVHNDSARTLRLDDIQAEYVAANRTRLEATPPREVPYVAGGQRPTLSTSPIPTADPRLSRRKNPLAAFEIENRAFAARMLPPGESAHGFFYFQTGSRPGARLYLTGIKEAGTGKELFYFEIPLAK